MICIVLFTHDKPIDRVAYARRTFNALSKLTASEPFWFHLADDGSDQVFRDEMMDAARERYGDNTSVTNSEGGGYGASYNLASQLTHQVADLILPLEDDWEVTRSFNLDPFAKVLREDHFNCIRMGYIGYTDLLRATLYYFDGRHYLGFDPDSSEKHVFAGGPRLEKSVFEREIGPWPEGLEAGHTELEVAGREAARQGIAWPWGDIKPTGDLFAHIGGLKAESGDPGSAVKMEEVVPS